MARSGQMTTVDLARVGQVARVDQRAKRDKMRAKHTHTHAQTHTRARARAHTHTTTHARAYTQCMKE